MNFTRENLLKNLNCVSFNFAKVFFFGIIPFSAYSVINHKIICETVGIRKFPFTINIGGYLLITSLTSLILSFSKYSRKESIVVKLENIDNFTNEKIQKKINENRKAAKRELKKVELK